MQFNLSEISKLIKERRSLKPEKFSARKVHKEQIERMLEAANWAPNHGNTEPWRFKVYSDNASFDLLNFMGELYKKYTPEEKFLLNKYENFSKRAARKAPLILVYRKRDSMERVPAYEEDWAVACAVQNLSLMAAAYGIGCFWSTPKMMFQPEFKEYTHLKDDEAPMGILYLGYPEGDMPEGRRNIWINKVEWIG